MIEIVRVCCGTRGAADALATSARSFGYLVEVRAAGEAGWIVVVEALAPATA
jgi:hypothetical protein